MENYGKMFSIWQTKSVAMRAGAVAAKPFPSPASRGHGLRLDIEADRQR
jgi:hypothetical protein